MSGFLENKARSSHLNYSEDLTRKIFRMCAVPSEREAESSGSQVEDFCHYSLL
jgi:hypothetical protein